jgi:uncharacterized protein (DUF433 family)
VAASAAFSLYDDQDPREVPAYAITEAARYLDMPSSTLRSWTTGQPYRGARGEEKFFEPIIAIADPVRKYLSFFNLFEAYVCDALRREHHVPLQHIRAGIDLIAIEIDPGSKHPLIEYEFATAGLSLFVEAFGKLIGVKSPAQETMRSVLETYLKRVDRDNFGKVMRLYPFTRSIRLTEQEAPRIVVIDPTVMFGRPVITGTRVTTAMVHQRWKAGEGVEALAEDYSRPIPEIEEALRCEHAETA